MQSGGRGGNHSFNYRWAEARPLSSDGAGPPDAGLDAVTRDSTAPAGGEQLLWLHSPLPAQAALLHNAAPAPGFETGTAPFLSGRSPPRTAPSVLREGVSHVGVCFFF